MKIKKPTKRIIVCVLALSLVVVGGVIYISNGPYTVNQVMADRVTLSNSVSQLEDLSDLIVLVTPKAQENVLIKDPVDNNVITGYTKTTATVLDVIKGNVTEGQDILITEECYTTNLNSVLWTQQGYLPMEDGDSYLLYLKAYSDTSSYKGMYFPVDLEYGKYVIPQTAPISAMATTYTTEQLQIGAETDAAKYGEWYQQVINSYFSNTERE